MTNSIEKPKVSIIGAGVSGLVAALQLEKMGYDPVIFEADSQVGGRVQTDLVEGYQLDRGFQVLLEAYPKAKQYLDYEALDLQKLDDGALLYHDGKGQRFGDPRRDRKFLVPTITTGHATLLDKWKVFSLNNQLAGKDISEVFEAQSQTTLSYLQEKQFSAKVINSFFRPFFSGIFLEPELATSSRMFEFVFKMFGEGSAVIPKKGMGAIPQYLQSQLRRTTIHFNTKVQQVLGTDILLDSGELRTTDFTIVASNPEGIIPNYASSLEWRACDTLYFTTSSKKFTEPIIGLNTHEDRLANNLFYPTSIECETKGAHELLSVTVVKAHSHSSNELVAEVTQELSKDFGISDLTFLKHYRIGHALPRVEDLQAEREAGEQLLTERIALAGDYLLNGSLNAAMESGEKAAEVANATLQNNFIKV